MPNIQSPATGLIRAIVAPLDIANIDTDAIIPKQFLQKVSRLGFGQHLFHDWRFLDDEGLQANPDFVLNQPRYQGAQILLTRENFGCGSSREHAPWALSDFGIRAIIASSFADIFYNNAINNQIIPICLTPAQIEALFQFEPTCQQPLTLTIDLHNLAISYGEHHIDFELDAFTQQRLINGLDLIDLSLQHQNDITEYEANIPCFLR